MYGSVGRDVVIQVGPCRKKLKPLFYSDFMSSPSFILMRFAAPRGYLRKTRLTIRKQKSPASGEKWQYFGSLYIDNVLRKHETSSQRDAFWEWSPEEFVVKPPRLLQTSSTVPMVSVSQRQYQETNEASDRLLKENRTLRTTIDRTAQQIKKATDALKRYEKLEETNMGLLKENQKMQNEIQEWKEYVCGLKQDSKADQTRINDLEEKLVLVQNSKPSSRRTANTQTTPIQNSQELPRTVTVGLSVVFAYLYCCM